MPKLQSIKAPGPLLQLVGTDGRKTTVTELQLTHDEYVDLMRAMQWPEDLPAFDRFWSPTTVIGAAL